MGEINLPEIIVHDSGAAGTNFVVSGAVHGNESCGAVAIRRALQAIADGKIRLKSGKVTFIPVANPDAHAKGVRYIDRNLNRNMFVKDSPVLYEEHLDNVICPVFEQADALLDLHSFTSEGEAFIFLGPPRKEEAEYARALGVRNFAHGWQDVYGAPVSDAQRVASQGTTEYTRLFNGLALTLECGNHADPEAVEVAFQAILNALRHFDIADIDADLFDPRPVSQGDEKCARLVGFYDQTQKGTPEPHLQNMSPVKKGELIAVFDDGSKLHAAHDGFVMMPMDSNKTDEEWLYICEHSDYFQKLGL